MRISHIASGMLASVLVIASAGWAYEKKSSDEWLERIEAVQRDDISAWRDYFALGQNLAALPGREGFDVIESAWPRIHDVRLKQQIIKAWHFEAPPPFRTRLHPQALEFFAFVLEENKDETASWVQTFLPSYAWRDFQSAAAVFEWIGRHRDEPAEAVAIRSMRRWIESVRTAALPAELVNLLPEIGYPLRRNPALQDAARESELEQVLLKAFEDPAVTTDAIAYGYFMLHELRPKAYPVDGLDAFLAPFAERQQKEEAAARAHLVESLDLRSLKGDDRKRWIVHAPPRDAPPADGWGLLIVASGGDGSVDFASFVRDTIQQLAGGYVVIQLIAPPIEDGDEEAIVWPREKLADDRVEFTMESIVLAAIEQAKQEFAIDADRVWLMGWSSGGPLAYEMAVRPGSPARGAFVIMSVFKPELMSPLSGARGKAFYILHSPDDFIPMSLSRDAEKQLTEAGARVHLQLYDGGHGWQGDSINRISDAIRWLENDRE